MNEEHIMRTLEERSGLEDGSGQDVGAGLGADSGAGVGRQKNPQEVFSWVSPLRAYKRRTAGVLRFYIALGALLSLVVFLMNERILVLPIGAIMFLFYVQTVTPPQDAEHRIMKFGIEIVGRMYEWKNIVNFYFIKKFEYNLLVLELREGLSRHVYIVIPNEQIKSKVLHLLSEHVIYLQNPEKTLTDRMADWLSRLMPDDEPDKPETARTGAEGQSSSTGRTESPAAV